VNLAGALLNGADFSGADLGEALLIRADLSEAILSQAQLVRADLTGIDFSKANTHGARLGKAYFSGRSETLLDESYQQSLRADTQRQQGKQLAGFEAEDLDERVHVDWANKE
jgi:uncharacterized protein YjbI with pentapeptide repeats